MEEIKESIQSSRGWESKQHCKRKRVQDVLKWASTCHKKVNKQTEKRVLDRPPSKKVFHSALEMKNAAVFPTKNPNCKEVVNALHYTERKT